ncbi:hypothetical protein EVAR_53620_1 [Eumeta japonica]|uniref:Uncharacterized protein n=1 Tax=Eumeta variegata TaxID=151549 RepID=A0A4C1WYA9_EUMVA|nr:hypothetical protein EVAR_53620_1 [Eumeta japonica]
MPRKSRPNSAKLVQQHREVAYLPLCRLSNYLKRSGKSDTRFRGLRQNNKVADQPVLSRSGISISRETKYVAFINAIRGRVQRCKCKSEAADVFGQTDLSTFRRMTRVISKLKLLNLNWSKNSPLEESAVRIRTCYLSDRRRRDDRLVTTALCLVDKKLRVRML